jgi:uncharacterized membrane protein YfcA
MQIKLWLFLPLLFLAALFLLVWRAAMASRKRRPTTASVAIGGVTDFFDTLGIGSFATTAALYKLGGQVADDMIPGTMMVGHTIPTILQAFIFMSLVRFDLGTLLALMAASVLGAWLGAGVVTRLPKRYVQVGVGVAMLASAGLMTFAQLRPSSLTGEALGLSAVALWLGVIGSFIIGSVTAVGIGSYAPSMVLYSLLGLSPLAAFPVMMGSAAFLMPVSSMRFCRAGKFEAPASIGLTLGGIPAVLAAAIFVKSLPVYRLRWLVVGVVLFAAALLLYSAWQSRRTRNAKAQIACAEASFCDEGTQALRDTD